MNPPILNLSNLSNLAVVVLEESNEKLSRCMQTFAKLKEKENVQIVKGRDKGRDKGRNKEQSLYESFPNVHTTYDSNKFDYVRGTTFLFDDCLEDDWWKDAKLRDFISYPRMYGITSVFGFRRFPSFPTRMCWNLDLICFGAMSSADREFVYDRFFLYLLSYDEFCGLLENFASGDGFLVLRREGTEDRIYRASC